MSLPVGTKLGRYEVRRQLGSGGMGEVYLAEDTKLDRKVALKILPATVASKQDRMDRFVREAKAAAALNHPNIAHIYEIGEQDGVHFIAMEYIDGQTLREKIHRDHSELKRLLRYLQQAAEGLSKAHAAGIVHRDLKPDNIMITRDGYAKILDFGLAKLVEPQGASTGEVLSEVATAMMPQHSLPGTVMGTAGYMSPEQARGRVNEIDHRSDVFSFGCILFEAVTKRKAFEGKDALDSLHNIVHAPTPIIKDLNPSAPEELQRIVRRCLAKDPEKRYQSIKEVAIELDELRQQLNESSEIHDSVHATAGASSTASDEFISQQSITKSVGGSTQTISSSSSSSRVILNELRRHKAATVLTIGGLVLLLGAGAWVFWKQLTGNEVTARGSAMKISRLVTGMGSPGNASISADGKYVAYAYYKEGNVSVRVKQVSTGSDREIVAPMPDAAIRGTVFSPDGELVYYSFHHPEKSPLGTLYQVPVIGGREPRKILEHLSNVGGFAADGKRIAFVRDYAKTGDTELIVANVDTGEANVLAKRGGQDWFFGYPTWSNDGKVIVCPIGTDTGGSQMTLGAISTDGGAVRPLTSHRWHGDVARPMWLQDGSGLIVNASESPGSPMQIWSVSYADGTTTRVTNDLTYYGSSSFGLTSDSSTIMTLISDNVSNVWVATANDGDADAKQYTWGGKDGEFGLDWTPDGRIVYVGRSGDYHDLWIMNSDGTGRRQLTSNQAFEQAPSVTNDGKHILYNVVQMGEVPHVWRMDIDGGNPLQLTKGETAEFRPFASLDGQWVFFTSWRTGSPRLWKVSINGGDPTQVSDLPFQGLSLLPEGKLITGRYFDDQVTPARERFGLMSVSDAKVVTIFDFPASSVQRQMLDERTMVYSEKKGDVDNLWSRPIAGGAPTQLTKFNSQDIFNFAVSRDRKKFAIVRGTSSADIILIKNFR